MKRIVFIQISACISSLVFSCEKIPVPDGGGNGTVGDKEYWYTPKVKQYKSYVKGMDDKDFNLIMDIQYSYDSNGRLIRMEKFESPYGFVYEEFYEYHGNSVTHTTKDHYGDNIVIRRRLTYAEPYIDEEPPVTEIVYYDESYEETGRYEYTYDDAGNNLLKRTFYVPGKDPIVLEEYKYDEQGRVACQIFNDRDGVEYRTDRDYVYNGTEETYYTDYKSNTGAMVTEIVKTVYYDSRMEPDRKLSVTLYDENLTEISFIGYEYDSLGRLIKYTRKTHSGFLWTQDYTYNGYVQTVSYYTLDENGEILTGEIQETEYLH